MKRIQIYKRQKGAQLYFKAFGLLFFIYGMSFLIKSFRNGVEFGTNALAWSYVTYTLLGLVLFVLGVSSKKLILGFRSKDKENENYFIQWDDKEIKYLLLNDKMEETILIADIKKISIQLNEITVELASVEKTLNLENVQYKELIKIKAKFEELKRNLAKSIE